VSSSEAFVTDPSPYRLTYLVKQLQEALLARLQDITQEVGLTPRQYTALSVLVLHPGISAAMLARLTFVTPQAAHEMVTTLERKGLLEILPDANDSRSKRLVTTRRHKAFWARRNADDHASVAQWFAGMKQAEVVQLVKLLAQAMRSVQAARVR